MRFWLSTLRMAAEPVARRCGTVLAVWLVAQGIPEETAQQVLLALGVLLGVGIDIAVSTVTKSGDDA